MGCSFGDYELCVVIWRLENKCVCKTGYVANLYLHVLVTVSHIYKLVYTVSAL